MRPVAKRLTGACKECGSTFTYWPSGKQLFCSRACYMVAHARTAEIRRCLYCNAPIRVTWRHRGSAPSRKYCNKTCYLRRANETTLKRRPRPPEFRSLMSRLAKARTPKPRVCDIPIYLTCEYCKRTYPHLRYRSKRERRRFCSYNCWHAQLIANPTKSSAYVDGRSIDRVRRGSNWRTQRLLALERDGHMCQVCGATPPARLHVHHIVPCRVFQSSIGAHALSNLVTLCVSCHPRVERAS